MKHWVYFLLNGNRIVYIGCTKDYNRRVNEHRSNGLKFDSYRIIECAGYEVAADYEKRWIRRFKPRYNKSCNPLFKAEKVNVVFYVKRGLAKRLREFAVKEQKTISIVVENALEGQYGI